MAGKSNVQGKRFGKVQMQEKDMAGNHYRSGAAHQKSIV